MGPSRRVAFSMARGAFLKAGTAITVAATPLWFTPCSVAAAVDRLLPGGPFIRNFTVWKDTAGKPISCHVGGITAVGDARRRWKWLN
jgi:hypothetical protein